MNARHYLAVFVKLFAAILLVLTLPDLVYLGQLGNSDLDQVSMMGNYLTNSKTILYLVLALLFWNFPLSISKTLLSPDLDGKPVDFNPNHFLTVAILSIGLCLFSLALTDGIYWVIYTQMITQGGESASVYLDRDAKTAIWTTAVELVVSLLLMLRGRLIAHRLLKVTR